MWFRSEVEVKNRRYCENAKKSRGRGGAGSRGAGRGGGGLGGRQVKSNFIQY